MNKETALKFCKYYKGEDANPYPHSVPWYLWRIEKEWTEEMGLENVVTEQLSDALDHYFSEGYSDFEKFDDTPITLKAMLHYIFRRWNEGFLQKKNLLFFTLSGDNANFKIADCRFSLQSASVRLVMS